MRQLQPVDVIVDVKIPKGGYTTEEMVPPGWTTRQVARFFFAKPNEWLIRHQRRGHFILDGQLIEIPWRVNSPQRYWRLYDVERVTKALARGRFIDFAQLHRTLTLVRVVAENHGFIEETLPPFVIRRYDPNREEEVHAVHDQTDDIDDLDGSGGARERSIALGGVWYELHLTDEHWDDLVVSLAPYLTVARKDFGRADDPGVRKSRAQVRKWARENGYQIGNRGRISMEIMRAYLQLNPQDEK